MKFWSVAVAAALLTVSAQAQDYIPYLDSQAANMQYGQMLEANMSDDNPRSAAVVPRAGGLAGLAGTAYFKQPARIDAAPVSFAYKSTAALRQDAAASYVKRVRASDANAGRLIAAEIAKNDFSRVYAGIVKPFGYRSDDAADSLAAYTLLGWLIATGASDPTPSQARAVRIQIAQQMAKNTQLSAPAIRGELGEELKLLFVTLHAGWQSARREGNLQQYSDGVTAMFKKFTGNNLRAMQLTERGFVRRQ